MSIVDTVCNAIFAPRNSLENPSVGLSDALDSEWNGLPYGSGSSAGVAVTRESALGFHAFYRACDLLGNYVGKLPVHICREENGGFTKQSEHPNFLHLLFEPSAEMNALTWKKTMEVHRMVEGNGYTFCRRQGSGKILEFVLLDPTQTWPVRTGGQLYYFLYRKDGTPQLLRRDDVIHIKGLGFDGLCGYGLRSIGRESLGAGIATIRYRAKFFKNNALPSFVIEVPAGMTDKAKSDMLKFWKMLHQGLDNVHGPGVVTGGTKVNVLSSNAKDNQLTDQEKFSLIEVSNFTGLPPHKLGDSSKVSYNSLEQENQAFLDDSLDWRLVDWEQELRRVVYTSDEKKDAANVVRFDREQLVRADISALAAYLDKAVGGPWLTVDEARAKQGMQERPGKEGDVLYGPSGAGVPSHPGEQPEPKEEEQPKPQKIEYAFEPLRVVYEGGLVTKHDPLPEPPTQYVVHRGEVSYVNDQTPPPITEHKMSGEVLMVPQVAAETPQAQPSSTVDLPALRAELTRLATALAKRIASSASDVATKSQPESLEKWSKNIARSYAEKAVAEISRVSDIVPGSLPDGTKGATIVARVIKKATEQIQQLCSDTPEGGPGFVGIVKEWAGRFPVDAVNEVMERTFSPPPAPSPILDLMRAKSARVANEKKEAQ